jgi:hypothetical protein
MERKILKWAKLAQDELKCFENLDNTVDYVTRLADMNMLKVEELSDERGVVAYMIVPDFRGNMLCSELFMYIKPEYRGNMKLFNEVIKIMEQAAKENGCKFVTIGANIGFRDDKLLRILSHYGYKPDTVKKEI